ncbi:MAG: signal peptidase II [Bacteroidetes bacterium]|nr:signal peptidase II [Bacteroidota bacterium]
MAVKGPDRPVSQAPHATRGYLLVLSAIAVAVYVLDQLTKMWVVETFKVPGTGQAINVVGDWARLVYSTNTGAAFGILQDRTLFFTLIAAAAIPIILLAQRELRRYGWPVQLTLGLLLGGTLGNLTDRLRLGFVVDFIDVGVGNLRWPTFNVADSAFVIGVGILLIYFLLSERDAA